MHTAGMGIRRSPTALVVVAVLAAALTGCDDERPDEEPTPEPVSIT